MTKKQAKAALRKHQQLEMAKCAERQHTPVTDLCRTFGHTPDLTKAISRKSLGYIIVPCSECGREGYLSGDVEWYDDLPAQGD